MNWTDASRLPSLTFYVFLFFEKCFHNFAQLDEPTITENICSQYPHRSPDFKTSTRTPCLVPNDVSERKKKSIVLSEQSASTSNFLFLLFYRPWTKKKLSVFFFYSNSFLNLLSGLKDLPLLCAMSSSFIYLLSFYLLVP